MNLVYRTKKHTRSVEGKLPFGAKYWTTTTAAVPMVKAGRKKQVLELDPGDYAPTFFAIASNTAVIRVPPQWGGERVE
jgi:hypothetical protein